MFIKFSGKIKVPKSRQWGTDYCKPQFFYTIIVSLLHLIEVFISFHFTPLGKPFPSYT
jgi:hypothetical protein